MIRLLRRAWLGWLLRCEERYVRTLRAEGWSDCDVRAMTHHCEALRVRLALQEPVCRT